MNIFRATVLCTLGIVCQPVFRPGFAIEPREPWEQVYSEEDAHGQEVVVHWSFDGEQPLVDTSVNQFSGRLEGAQIDTQGKFKGALRCFPGWPVNDQRHRLLVPNELALTPKGPFTIELWTRPDPAFEEYPEAFLVDKKYVADTDYQFIIGRPDANGTRRLQANLGFGTRSQTWYSEPVRFSVATWIHVAFVYDGAGTGRFFVNGRLRGERYVSGLGSIAAGRHALSIGDRVGSYYHGFPGLIDQFRIVNGAREFRPLVLDLASDRHHFVRGEPHVKLECVLTNLRRSTSPALTVKWSLDGCPTITTRVASLATLKQARLSYPLDTWLRPDSYQVRATVADESGSEIERVEFPISIVARPVPNRFPVVMWGAGLDDAEQLREIGFTHALGVSADFAWILDPAHSTAAPPERVAETRRKLDAALAAGITYAASLSPGNYLRQQERLRRVDRQGIASSNRPDICGLFPEASDFCFRVGTAISNSYGDLPAFGAALLHTEVRDAAQPCFHEHDRAAFRQATGHEIPEEVRQKWGVDYHKLKSFPEDRVIPDDDLLYEYLRWYWKSGDGWNALNGRLQTGLREMKRPDFWTWHDPAVRVASVYGTGGDVDVLSQWTYSYPDPIRIGVATDELLAMARGSERHQQVMKMTQVIWYRSQTAPIPNKDRPGPSYRATWEKEQPDAPFITIAPMQLREAFWTKIARPIRGIMYHGWQSLVPTERPSGYRYTNAATRYELQHLIDTVIRPLGPTLRSIPGIESDVAYYESFSSEMFARRGTYGWGGKWMGDAYLVARWAGLQPDIVFDETIQQESLDKYKLLFMMDCDVLLESVAKRIHEFQRRGGIVIGDEHTAPAIQPDIVLTSYKRTGPADKDKRTLQQLAIQLRERLAGKYELPVDSSSRDIIIYRRAAGAADYLFLINDHRSYGRYVGQHGLVMEDGKPTRSVISLNRPDRVTVYDLVAHRPLACEWKEATASRFTVTLGPCEGRMLLVTPQPIDSISVEGPAKASCGEHVELNIQVFDPRHRLVDAVVPLNVRIEDSQGLLAEQTGAWATQHGQVTLPLDLARNDRSGTWSIHVTDLASGQSAHHYFEVRDRQPVEEHRAIDPKSVDPVQPKG